MNKLDDTAKAPDEMSETEAQAEFTELQTLNQHPGFVRFVATMQAEQDLVKEKLFSDETAVIDLATFFTREEVIATGKVLHRYLTLVSKRLGELTETLEKHKRSRT